MHNFVKIMEVAPRDGLQNEKVFVPTEQKLKFIDNLAKAGLKRIEATAFVSPKWIPALKDHNLLGEKLIKDPKISYAALVPNLQGYLNAKKYNFSEISLVISATESHNQKNLNTNTQKVLERYLEIISQAKLDKIKFRVYISCAFGCPFEGQVSPKAVLDLANKFNNLGAYELVISDTIGIGNPKQTQNLVKLILKEIPKDKIALHLHDTHDMALANIFAALELGVRSFDSAASGLGGCPYAPGAKGNIATEKLIYMLHSLGFETGVNLEKLKKASQTLTQLSGLTY